MVLVGTVMVTKAVSAGFDWLYPVRVFATGAVLWCFRRHYAGLFRSWSWQAVLIGVAVFALWLALEPRPSAEANESCADALRRVSTASAFLWIVLRVVGSVVTVPLAEELAFRGYLTRRLIAADFEKVTPGRFTWLSFVGSSVLFGLLHGRLLAGLLAGMLYALALYRRKELSDAVVAHATTNALIAAHVLATGTWSLWS